MEAKIDGLVTLLKSTQNPSLNNELLAYAPDVNPTKPLHAPPTPSSPGNVSRAMPSDRSEARELRSPWLPALTQDGSGSISLLNTNTHRVREIRPWFGIRPTPGEAEAHLSRFRQMLAYFPVIVLPASTKARDLLLDRPFLYHCIMAVSCPTSSQQIVFGDEMMRYLGEHILVKGTKSLDLLLGILTYAGWFVPRPMSPSFLELSARPVRVKLTDRSLDIAGIILTFLFPQACASFYSLRFPWYSTWDLTGRGHRGRKINYLNTLS